LGSCRQVCVNITHADPDPDANTDSYADPDADSYCDSHADAFAYG
jgi:hypothetical protein